MPRIDCFWCVRAPTAQQSLRRLVFADTAGRPACPRGHHDSSAVIGNVPWVGQEWGGLSRFPTDGEKLDPRWPRACACGYEFRPDDLWYHETQEFYRREPDTGERWLMRALPPGAMWDAYWLKPHWVGPDGIALAVQLPGSTPWHVDGPHNVWQRTGTIPNVTARPSILVTCTNGYHGYLTDGHLDDC